MIASAECIEGPVRQQAGVAYIGRPGVDIYAPVGAIGEDAYVVGGKHVLARGSDGFAEYEDRKRSLALAGADRYPGGVTNGLADTVCTEMGAVRFATVLGGPEDAGSVFIRQCMQAINAYRRGSGTIEDWTIEIPGFQIPEAIIDRRRDAGGKLLSRMVTLSCGDEMHPYISETHVAELVDGVDVVIASSVNDPQVSERVFDATRASGAKLGVNWGSWELKYHLPNVQRLMGTHRPYFVAVNLAEVERVTFGHNGTAESEEAIGHAIILAEKATATDGWAQTIAVTLGKFGIVLARDGGSLHIPAAEDPPGVELDHLGAGDRVFRRLMWSVMCGDSEQQIRASANGGVISLLRRKGGHGDWFERYKTHLAAQV